MSEDFNPFSADRQPRSEGYKEETQQLFNLIQEERGDQRIGQFLINAVRSSDKFEEVEKRSDESWHAQVEQVMWGLEAPELLKMVEDYIDRA